MSVAAAAAAAVPDPLDKAWEEFAGREYSDVATRIWGLWSADATPFYVFVLRPAPTVSARIAPVNHALTGAGIRTAISPQFMHITVQSLGNEGEGGLTAQIAGALADVVTDALRRVPPCGVRLARVGPFGAGVFVAVEETDAAHSLARMQRAVVDALLVADRVPVRHPDRPYLPHLSVCYFDAPQPTAPILDALAPYRATDFGLLPVEAIELVRVSGDGSLYPPMETVRRIPLGG